MRLTLWPQSLFGRLLAASVAAVLLAQAVALLLIAQEREHFVLQGSVREWTRHIVETTQTLAPLNTAERARALAQLSAAQALQPPHLHPGGHVAPHRLGRGFLRLPLLGDVENTLREQLRAALGPDYGIEIGATPAPPPAAIALPAPFYEAHELALHPASAQRYDVTVRFPDGDAVTYRVMRLPGRRADA